MRAAPLLVLALLVAGCAAPAPDAPQATAEEVLPWGMESCRYVVAFVPADPAKLQARMPEGWQVATGPVAPVGLGEGARLGVEAFECARGQGLDGVVEGLVYGSLFAAAIPPEDVDTADLTFTYVKWDTLVPDKERREHLAARGLPARGGSVSWDGGPAQPPGSIFARLRLDDVGTFAFTLAPVQDGDAPTGAEGPFAEFTPLDGGGLARWTSMYEWDAGTQLRTGRGTVELPEGSWAADAVGARVASATFHAGTWSFHNATITLPARPA